jgi:polygalacturonase
MKRAVLFLACFTWLPALFGLIASAQGAASPTPADDPWAAVPQILNRIKPPHFLNRDFMITDHGAKPGEDATVALARAIAACHNAGGGRVLVPAGLWPTGPIHLKSNVNLHVAEGATLQFTTDPTRFPVVFTRWEGMECMNYSPLIYAFEQENIAVTGKGVLDGSASKGNWWSWANHAARRALKQDADNAALNAMAQAGVPVAERIFGPGHYLRPTFVEPYRCKNVLIEGVTIKNSPFWVIHPTLCVNVTVRDVTVSSKGPNNDGCNPESSRDVLIEGSVFDTGDDCIAIKSGRNNDGRRVAVASENIVIRDCTMKDGHGGVVIGSEISGHCRNVFVENCRFDSARLGSALRFKNNAMRGGVIENIFMRDVTIARVAGSVLLIQLNYGEGAAGPHTPVIRRVQLDRITAEVAPRVIRVLGIKDAVIEDIHFSDSTIRGLRLPDMVSHAGRIVYERVTLEPLAVAP